MPPRVRQPVDIVTTEGTPTTINGIPNPVYQRIQTMASPRMGNQSWIPTLATYVPFSTSLRPGNERLADADRIFADNIYSALNGLGIHVTYNRDRIGSSQHYGVPQENIEQELTIGTNRRRYNNGEVNTQNVQQHTFTFSPFADVVNGITERPRSTLQSLTLQHQNIPAIQLIGNEVKYAPVNASIMKGNAENRRFNTVNTVYPDLSQDSRIERTENGRNTRRYESWDTREQNSQNIATAILNLLNERDRALY